MGLKDMGWSFGSERVPFLSGHSLPFAPTNRLRESPFAFVHVSIWTAVNRQTSWAFLVLRPSRAPTKVDKLLLGERALFI